MFIRAANEHDILAGTAHIAHIDIGREIAPGYMTYV
jgi:hypothetical protein